MDVQKTLKDYSKGGVTAGIAIFFLIQMNTKMDKQAIEIVEIKENQRELMITQRQLRGEVTGLWKKYNEALSSKDALSEKGQQAYMGLIERINTIERKID